MTRSHGDCEVTVELIDSSDLGTWTAVNLVATLLMAACTDISMNRGYTGGYASAGNAGGLKITLRKYEDGLGVGNASSLTTG